MEILVMVKCSYCGQENREELANCAGCGTPLSSARSGLEPAPRYTPLAKRRLIHGGFWLAGGLLVTTVTYRSASPGAPYLVAWGAILFGAVQLLQGLFGGRQPPRLENAGYDELEAATRLEARGRLQEAAAAYQRVAERFAGMPAGSDARKSLENLQVRLKEL